MRRRPHRARRLPRHQGHGEAGIGIDRCGYWYF
jgi:hypothetical protein